MNKKTTAFRGIRKTAHLSRKVLSRAANFSEKVENKADSIIHGTDPTIQIHDTVLLEKVLAERLPEIVPLHPAMPKVSRSASVTLLLPSLQKSSFFGGTATALIVAASIAMRKNMPLRIIETLVHGKARVSDLDDFLISSNIGWTSGKITTENLAGRKYNHYGYLDIHPDDLFIASAWWDAYLLDKLPLNKKYIYLIQDFEPIFYNNSDHYALAESTYHSDKFVALCNTELMYKFMLNRNYHAVKSGTWFEPAVSRTKITRQQKNKDLDPGSKKKLFLYARPNVERNLFSTMLSAVDYAFTNGYLDNAGWDVIMAGQDKLPNIQLSTGVIIQSLGKMDMDKYIDLLNTVNIAVSPMMAPHPNYPTLEFASAGAQVVTTRYDIKQNLSNYSKNIILADISAESIAGAINKATARLKSTSAKPQPESKISSSWLNSLAKPIDQIIKDV